MPNEHVKGAGAANAFDKYTATKTGIAVGLAKGHVVNKRTVVKKAPRKNYGKTSKRLQNIRAIAREVCGLAPYEKRILDTLKLGAGNVEKKMYKMAKQRLGTHRRACAKREEIKDFWQKARAAMPSEPSVAT